MSLAQQHRRLHSLLSQLSAPAPASAVPSRPALRNAVACSSALEFPVWPGAPPGSQGRPNEEVVVNERVRNTHTPTLTAHHPPAEVATGAAVIVCPGGGYRHLAINKEGHQVGQWLATCGVAAFVLKYRLGSPTDATREEAEAEALADALQSLRLVRSRAPEWNIDVQRVGVMGFSAGAHLAVNALLHAAPAEGPNFLAPIYVYAGGLDLSDLGSKAAGVPTFIAGASDDATTPPSQAWAVYEPLHRAGVPVELHLFERGGHGFGLAKAKGPVRAWTHLCEEWMRQHGLCD